MGDKEKFPCGHGENGYSKAQKLETGIDLMSKLPDSLVVEILSMMPIKDACKTMFLSNRWKYLWTAIDNVCYGQDIDWSDDVDVNRHISFVDNALRILSCSKIKKFHLEFGFCAFKDYRSKLDKWLGIAMQDLELRIRFYNPHQLYSLPEVVCSNSSLEKLKCWNCCIPEDSVINWTSLKSLTLNRFDNDMAKVISGCPLLECLELCDSKGFQRLHMTSPNCRSVQITGHTIQSNDRCLEILASYVQHLKISGKLNCTDIRLKDMSCLVKAELTFKSYDVRLEEPNYERLGGMVQHLLESISCVDELTILSWFIEVVAVLEIEGFSFPLLHMKHLTMSSLVTKYTIVGMGVLLRSAPHLESLELSDTQNDWEYIDYTFDDYWEDNDLEEEVVSIQGDVFMGSMRNLKNVKITSMWCYYGEEGSEMFELMENLLMHAVILERLVIASAHRECNLCSAKMANMADNSSAFARAYDRGIVHLLYQS